MLKISENKIYKLSLSVNHLIRKDYPEEQDGLPVLANTEYLFSDEDNLHLPTQAASISFTCLLLNESENQ